MSSRVLVISVHPDDETLGCGGTILKHRNQGDELYWAIITRAHEPQWSAEIIARKAVEIQQVAEAYGVARYFHLEFPTVRMDTVPLIDVMEQIRAIVAQVKPAIVYLVHSGDIHTDHQISFSAILSVLKPFYMNQLGVRRVLSYETLSSTEAAPAKAERGFFANVFSDITPYIDRKIAIMNLYGSESQSELLPRGASAIRALARYRGATIGVEYAEAFMLIREVF